MAGLALLYRVEIEPLRHSEIGKKKKIAVYAKKKPRMFADKKIITTFVLLLRRVSSAG